MGKRLILAIAAIVMALAIAGGFQNPTSVHGSYAAAAGGDLLWYRHDGREDGSFRWTDNNGRKAGSGWNFKEVFSGDNGVIYAITADGDLLWYRHDGRDDGSFRWADNNGRKVGSGWNFKEVFSGGDGVIYAVANNGGSSGASSAPRPLERAIPRAGGLEAPRQEQLPPPENPTCRNYAYRAIDQYKLTIKYAKCRVNSDGRWNADYKGHYNWCLTAPQAARTNELKLRDDHLYRCGAQSTYD
jgi:hypothetical protein